MDLDLGFTYVLFWSYRENIIPKNFWLGTYLQTHDQQVPGNKGATATPTAAVVLALFAQIALVQLWIDEQEVAQLSGVQPHHLLVCDALGLDPSWYAVPSGQKNLRDIQTP